MQCVSALSTAESPESAVAEVLERVETGLRGERADLAVVFASAEHRETLGAVAAQVRARGLSETVLGCSGESIVGEGREVEGGPALVLWAARLPGVSLRPLRVTFVREAFEGWTPPAEGGPSPRALLLLGDPFSFPADVFLQVVEGAAPGLPIIGGMASAGHRPGDNRLVLNGEVFDAGGVAVEIGGPVAVNAIVSQGCRPIGRTMIVTKADRNVILELGRRNAREVLQETFEALDDADKALLRNGLHLGRVVNEYQETFRRGDFLVRNVIGVDEAGGIAVTDLIRVGQTVQFHVRDADTATEDLDDLLEGQRGSGVGALLFTCNGRGSRMFPTPDHDASAVRKAIGPAPVAGFFAMGELGPIGGRNFLHGFTASLAVFGPPHD